MMHYLVACLYVLVWLTLAALAALWLPRWLLPFVLVQLAAAYVIARAALLSMARDDDSGA